MNRSCFVYRKIDEKTSKTLDENAQIPLAQPNLIRKINKRSAQGDDRLSMTAGDFVEPNASNESPSEVEIRIRMSSDVASQLMCHGNSAAYNTSFKINKNEKTKILQLTTEDWAKYNAEYSSEDKREMSAEIGRLAEQAISTKKDGAVSVQSGFLSPSNNNCVRLVEREIDTIYLNGRGKYEPGEVKCVGQLTMSKVKLFNTRLFPLVAKAIASQNGATFIVVRDDREMDLKNKTKTDSERMPILEIMYWEDVARLILPSDCEKLENFHGSFCCTLEKNYNNVKSIKIGAKNIEFCGEKGKLSETKPLSCKANIPKFIDNTEKAKKQIVIVGPNIPYFEFRLSNLYMIYKHKHKKSWFMNRHYNKVMIIANTMEDLKIMFQTYERHPNQQQLDITFITREIFNKNDGLVVGKFMKDKIKSEQFTTFNNLGKILYDNKLTYWEKPIPACLLLLGKGQHIPIKMITSRLSFGILHEDETTGINLSECVEPDLIAIIGTKEECKTGNELIKKEFPTLKIHNFCLEDRVEMNVGANTIDSNLCVLGKKDGPALITCLPHNLDIVMEKFNFPMYKNFTFNGKWVAE